MTHSAFDLVHDRIKYLRENTDFVSTLFESLIGYAIIAADFDGNIIAFNEGAHQIYGYTPEEIIGKQSIEIFFPKDFIESGRYEKAIYDLIGGGKFSYEGEKVRKNGERFPAQILFTLTRDHNGKVVGFVEIVGDLTERKRAEKERAEAKAELIEQLEGELRSLRHLSGSKVKKKTLPRGKLIKKYAGVVKGYVTQADKSPAQTAEETARDFFKEGLSGKDVVDIHLSAMDMLTKDLQQDIARRIVEGARFLLLGVMTNLADLYRGGAN